MAITDIVALPFGDPFGHFATDETSEQWLAQVTVDLSDYDNARFAAAFGATIRAADGAIPTFKVYMYNASMGATPPVCVLFITPATTPSDWTAALVSTARVVGRGPTTFSLYGVSSALPCVYYLRDAGSSLNRTANPTADTFTVTLYSARVGYPVHYPFSLSGGSDPGLAVIPHGTHTFRIWAYATGNPCLIGGALYCGGTLLADSDGGWLATIAVGSSLVEYSYTYVQSADIAVTPGSVEWRGYVACATGAATVVMGIGGSTATSITATWPGVGLVSEINAASLTLEFGDVDPAPRRAPPGPVGGDDIWLAEVD